MYSDLGKSISQVKDILASMAEMVGGEERAQAIRGQLQNFEDYSQPIDNGCGLLPRKNLPKRLGRQLTGRPGRHGEDVGRCGRKAEGDQRIG